MKILKSILNYIPLATFIIFVVTDGIFSLTSALIFVISTIGLLINWKRKKTEMKNWENSNLLGRCREQKSEFVERFPELSLFFKAFSLLNSEMICIFPYFCPCEIIVREIREISFSHWVKSKFVCTFIFQLC